MGEGLFGRNQSSNSFSVSFFFHKNLTGMKEDVVIYWTFCRPWIFPPQLLFLPYNNGESHNFYFSFLEHAHHTFTILPLLSLRKSDSPVKRHLRLRSQAVLLSPPIIFLSSSVLFTALLYTQFYKVIRMSCLYTNNLVYVSISLISERKWRFVLG